MRQFGTIWLSIILQTIRDEYLAELSPGDHSTM